MADKEKTSLKTIQEYLEQTDRQFVVDPKGFIRLIESTKHADHHVVIDVLEDIDFVKVLIIRYLNGEKTDNAELHKALLHASAEFPCVRFSWNPATGEVRVGCIIHVDDVLLHVDQLNHALAAVTSVADSYYPIFQRILWVPGMTAADSFEIKNAEDKRKVKKEKAAAFKPVNRLAHLGEA